MNLVCTHRNPTEHAARYATSADFATLFAEDMTSLYLLSYALTANHEKAERCFVTGLEDCARGNFVFQKWARSWSRRTIVLNAIRMMSPHAGLATGTSPAIHLASRYQPRRVRDEDTAIAGLLALGTFERFVLVLSVLERYSDQECSTLLRCSPNDFSAGRARALQQLADMTHQSAAQNGSVPKLVD